MDIEANGFLEEVTKIHCAHLKTVDGKQEKTFTPDNISDLPEFLDTVDALICHNVLMYDLPVIKKILGYEYKGKAIDTLVMSRVLNPKRQIPFHAKDKRQGPHTLYAWGVRVGVDKPDHSDWENFSEDMLFRCKEDVEINRKTYLELLKESKQGNWRDALLLSHKLFENLQKQEGYGWYIDREHLKRSLSMLDHWMKRLEKVITPNLPHVVEKLETKVPKKEEYNYIQKPFLNSGKLSKNVATYCDDVGWDHSIIGGVFSRVLVRKVDVNKRAELIPYLLGLGWVPDQWNISKTTGERTSPKLSIDDPFEGIEDKTGKLVARRLQCRHRHSLIEGLERIIRPDGAISAGVADITTTYRMRHRGVVNIPKGDSFFGKWLRKLFSCREGKVLVGADSAGNQLRQFAARMGDDAYTAEVLGDDIHSYNQSLAGLPTRDNAKTFIYGFLFGAGNDKIGRIVGGSSAHGAELKARFLARIPKLEELLDKLKAEWRKTAKKRFNPKFNNTEYYDGTITGLDGRPIVVPSEHMLLVYLVQSDEAIQMSAAYNIAFLRLSREFEWGKQWAFVSFYHDEYTVECVPEIADRVKFILEQSIVDAGKFYKISCPHEGDGKIGKNWYEIH